MVAAAPLALRPGDRPRLEALTRSTSVRAGLAQRARIVLLAADGVPNTEIARRTGSTRPTVLAWRNRYLAEGIDGLRDKPRSGRPATVDEIEVVATTLADDGRPPEHLGATHWSSRLLAKELGISNATVARIWRKWGIQPDRVEAFRCTIDPEVDPGGAEIYRNPPERPAPYLAPNPASAPLPGQRPAQHPDPWLNLVEVSIEILTRQAIRRGTFASVHNLIEALGALTDDWNDREEPPTRTGQAPTVPKDRKANSNTRQPNRRSSHPNVDLLSGLEVDLRRGSERLASELPDRTPLRDEYHEARCGPTAGSTSWGDETS
ncbi:MAG: helix-turn-helix domain-containing protein [Pseudonocardiaceae bacterium]